MPARTMLTLHPPSPPTVLLSCLKESQCINCREYHLKELSIFHAIMLLLGVHVQVLYVVLVQKCCRFQQGSDD